jgi:hypothetical protein
MRTRTLLLLATMATIVPIWLAGPLVGERGPEAAPAALLSRDGSSATARALAVLSTWDRQRAAAWRVGDPGAMARLYVRGSRTGARDVGDLRRWVGRGLHVSGLRQQVASLRVVARSPARIVVVVTERTVDGIAEGRGRRTAVPTSAWATHRVALRHLGGGWRVAEAVAQPAR